MQLHSGISSVYNSFCDIIAPPPPIPKISSNISAQRVDAEGAVGGSSLGSTAAPGIHATGRRELIKVGLAKRAFRGEQPASSRVVT